MKEPSEVTQALPQSSEVTQFRFFLATLKVQGKYFAYGPGAKILMFSRESFVCGSTRERKQRGHQREKDADLPREGQWLPRLTERGSVAAEHRGRPAWPWRLVRQDSGLTCG